MATPATQLVPATQSAHGLFSSSPNRRALLSLLITLLTLAAYNPAAHNEFVSFDDPAYVTGNPHVQAGLKWSTVKWAFQTTENANWHPVTWLSHALDCQLFQGRAAGHHYVSVLLHAICALLLFLFLESVTGLPWRSAVVAALFAIHPLNVESVAWISERKSVLCMLFFILALLAYCWHTTKPDLKRYSLVAVPFALALMSKPMAITLPFVLLLLDYWPLQRDKQTSWFRLVYEKLPLLALSAASAVITIIVQRQGGAIHGKYSFWNRIMNAVVSYAWYLKKAVWPSHLTAFYPHPDHFSAWQVILALTVFLLITAAVFIIKEQRYLRVGWLWFLGTMVPVIGLVQVGEQGMADRYAYIPFVGLFFAVVWGIAESVRARDIPKLYPAIFSAVVILGFCVLTEAQIGYWRNTVSLWTHALTINDRNTMAHDSMGAELINQGRIPEAISHLQASATIDPKDPFSQLDLGICDKQQGRPQDATEHYRAALRLSTDPSLRASAFGNLGSIYRAAGDFSQARKSYEAALSLLPGNKYAWIGLGLIAQKEGDMAHASEYYSQASKVEPAGPEYLLLAQALSKAGHRQEAQAAYAQAQAVSRNWDATVGAVNHLLEE
jgi:Flp pilus assembly protein TadD